MTEDQIKHLVNRFLGWKLPHNFSPDNGISFTPIAGVDGPHPFRREPVGTNLFSGTEADAMVRYMTEGMPPDHTLMDALVKALEVITAMDPKGIRADDLGRAARIAREALNEREG